MDGELELLGAFAGGQDSNRPARVARGGARDGGVRMIERALEQGRLHACAVDEHERSLDAGVIRFAEELVASGEGGGEGDEEKSASEGVHASNQSMLRAEVVLLGNAGRGCVQYVNARSRIGLTAGGSRAQPDPGPHGRARCARRSGGIPRTRSR